LARNLTRQTRTLLRHIGENWISKRASARFSYAVNGPDTLADISPPSASSPTATGTTERYHGLDHLRAVAMLLGIYLHAAISYMHTPVPWAIRDPSRSYFFDLSVAAIHGFRMQLFFFIAGFFACMVHGRMGGWPFFKRRLLRIGVPFVGSMITILPLVFVVWKWGADVSGDANLIAEFSKPPGTLSDLPTGHLWFLQYLLFYYGAVLLLGPVGRWMEQRGLNARLDGIFATTLRAWWKPVLLAMATFGFLIGGPQIGEPEQAGISIVPRFGAVLYYGAYFLFGWWLFRQRALLSEFKRFPVWNGLVALLAFGCYGASMEGGRLLGADATKVALIGNYAAEVFTWAMLFLFTGIFLRHFNQSRPWSRYAAEASYWFYLAHLPLVIAFQTAFYELPIGPLLKCGLVNALSIVILLLTYHLMVRYTPIGTLLNGKRSRAASAGK
jgi:glucans biosynthesis protein C